MKPDDITAFFKALQKQNPNPEGELYFTNPYTLLVAVALSAQATDVSVNKATKELFKIVKTPTDMLKLGEAKLKNYIKTIGLFNSKAKNLIAMAKILVEDYDGEIPKTREALTTLPGVGRKTANVVLNIAFDMPTIAVDTHLFRVCNRTKLAVGKTPLAVELKLDKKIPANFKKNAHIWLILHGRYTCTARSPKCGACVVAHLCAFKGKTAV
jgi:endonuclease-3